MEKTYYYHFNKLDQTFIAMLLGLGMVAYTDFKCLCAWGVFIVLALVWGYKNILRQKAVIITDKGIKIDHSKPILWKDIKDAEIKTVTLCGYQKMKILSLNPKKGIQYKYNWLQKHNADFGPFPIPLYGLLTEKDEKKIVKIVKKHVKIK